MPPRVLVASTTWFAMPARVASAFLRYGAEVSAICPKGNPIHKISGIQSVLRYSSKEPTESLRKAILATQPDLIIPCDDRVVEHLHRLHITQSTETAACQPIIERSLGDPAGFATSSRRGDLLRLAEQVGIRIPMTGAIRDLSQLREWLDQHGYPAVLKIDGTWAGSGVRVIRTWEQARQAFVDLTSPLSLITRTRFLCAHDFFPLFSKNAVRREELTIQSFIRGKSVNAMYACWRGELLDHLSVEALYAVDQLGSSTIIKTILNEEMERAGRLLINKLGTTGFCGIDFIIDSKSGLLYLIELNPRITQIGHLEPGGKQNLITTLCDRWAGKVVTKEVPFVQEVIALFPHSLRCKPNFPLLASPNLRHDIPVDAPELVLELSRKPWNSRHLSAMVFKVISHLVRRSPPAEMEATAPLADEVSEEGLIHSEIP